MKLSEYIRGLQQFLEENGDLPCYYAADDEGNSYQEVSTTCERYWIEELTYSTDVAYHEECRGDYAEDENPFEDLIPICVVN